MTDRKQAIFRLDATPAIGGGHAMRCLVLADQLAADGWSCIFISAPGALAVVPALGRHRVVELDAIRPDHMRDLGAGGCDLLVVDHYGLDAAFERACAPWAGTILVVDDLADRPHHCDLLLDQNRLDGAQAYAGLVPKTATVLSGPSHALLRRDFRDLREATLRRRTPGAARQVLVSMGLTDPSNQTEKVLRALEHCRWPDLQRVAVLLGSGAPHLERVRAMLPGLDLPVDLHLDDGRVAERMAEADLAVGAGGSTSWERCCLGLPTAVISVADNQLGGIRCLDQAGAALVLGRHDELSVEAVAQGLSTLAQDPKWRYAMAQAASDLCDGRGVHRVLAAIGRLGLF